jgi:Thrombospondin type 3 repeat
VLIALAVSTAFPEISAGIQGGTPASDGNVFFISFPRINGNLSSGQGNCTAVLITPGHLLIAAHCMNGSHNVKDLSSFLGSPIGDDFGIDQNNAVIRIQNAPLPSPGIQPLQSDVSFFSPALTQFAPPLSHIYSTLDLSSPIDFSDQLASVGDIAVIPLNRRVPLGAAKPAQLPFHNVFQPGAGAPLDNLYVGDPCPQSFDGRVVGYGTSQGTFPSRRQADVFVTRQLNSSVGDVYRTDYTATQQFQDLLAADVQFFLSQPFFGDFGPPLADQLAQQSDQHSLEQGDSGGPLFHGSEVCGINSANGVSISASKVQTCIIDPFGNETCVDVCVPGTDLCVYQVTFSSTNRHARVDSPTAVAWLNTLQPPLYDSRHNLFATCPAGTPAPFDDMDTDGDFIPDGCDPCPYVPDPSYAATGLVTDTPDQDSDGVPDICDNCPLPPESHKNPYVAANGVIEQPDADNDGVGDACDSCPHSDIRLLSDVQCCNADADCQGNKANPPNASVDPQNVCTPIAAFSVINGLQIPGPCVGFAGRCPLGRDWDRDGTGDNCDNCPPRDAGDTDSSNDGQKDSDGDGVGDVCDNCRGSGSYPEGVDHTSDQNVVACFSDADCTSVNADGVCVPGQIGTDVYGNLVLLDNHCSKFHDSDGDGLGDVCDNCKFTPNAPSYGAAADDINHQPNCNLLNEIAIGESYPFTGDACDPNPCNRIFKNGGYSPDPNVIGDLWQTISYDPQILPNSQPPAFPITEGPFANKYVGTPVATIGARNCPCSFVDHVGSAWECHLTNQCPIDASHYDTSAFWLVPSVVATPIVGGGPAPGLLLPSPPASYFAPGAEIANATLELPPQTDSLSSDNLALWKSAPSWVSWDVTRDGAQHGVIPGEGFGTGLIGVLWTAVRDVPQVPAASVLVLRDYSNRYDGGFFGQRDTLASGLAKLICPICDVRACKSCLEPVEMINLVIQPAIEKVYGQWSKGSADLTGRLSPAALTSLFEPNTRSLAAAERGGWLTTESVGLASFSADGTTVKSALAVVGGTMQNVLGGRIIGTGPVGLASTELGPSPSARTDYGAVLSATEDAIFVFGGKLASGKLAEDFWRYEIGTVRWRQLYFTGPAPRRVLAATYTPETRSLWILDQGAGKFGFARLLRFDLPAREMKLVGAWPRSPIIDRVELSEAPYGDLLLAGSSSLTNHVAGVVLRPDGNTVKVVGAFLHKGKLALEPTLNDVVLTLPLLSTGPTGVDNTVIPADEVMFEEEGQEGKFGHEHHGGKLGHKHKGKGPKPPNVGIGSCL